MPNKSVAYLFVAAFLIGVGAAALVYNMNKPTAEQDRVAQIDRDIQDEMCERLRKDISDFEKAPNTYRRTALNTIYSEAIVTTKATSLHVKKDESIAFTGETKDLVELCTEDAKRWVKIPTYFPAYFEEEYLAVFGEPASGETISSATKVQDTASNDMRLALVIGNSRYQDSPLKNPVNDAEDISEVLRGSGFHVLEHYDLDTIQLRRVIADFEDSLSEYTTALLYYSGHGIELGGRNFFIPIDADIKSEEEIPRQGIDITTVIEKVNRTNLENSIFIIDACRSMPVFSKFRDTETGLAAMQTTGGSVIAYSAAPGKIAIDGDGRNSPYTNALIKELQTPGKKIEDILKDTAKEVQRSTAGRQTPWYNSSLTGDFYFRE